MADDEKAGGSSAGGGGESAHCNVLSWEQVQRLDRILSETIPIHGRGNFPTLAMQPRQIVKVVRSRLEEKGIGLRDVRLNGSAASHVLHQDSGLGYKDLDLIFCADLKGEAEFQTVKDVVLDCLLDFLPEGVNKEKITPLTLKVNLPSAQTPGAGRCERLPAESGHLPPGDGGVRSGTQLPPTPSRPTGAPSDFFTPCLKPRRNLQRSALTGALQDQLAFSPSWLICWERCFTWGVCQALHISLPARLGGSSVCRPRFPGAGGA